MPVSVHCHAHAESRRFNLLLAEEANVADVACCLRDRLGLPQHIQLELPQDLQSLQGEVHVQVPATALMRLPEEVEPVPASAVLNTELAHERALMAWTRTSLATTKMMFCFAFVPIAYDKRFKISYSMILSIALVVVATLALLVGWQRYHQLRQSGLWFLQKLSEPRIATPPVEAASKHLYFGLQNPDKI